MASNRTPTSPQNQIESKASSSTAQTVAALKSNTSDSAKSTPKPVMTRSSSAPAILETSPTAAQPKGLQVVNSDFDEDDMRRWGFYDIDHHPSFKRI